jgi:pimeloyl-ACP methyl ester carboxylesterase
MTEPGLYSGSFPLAVLDPPISMKSFLSILLFTVVAACSSPANTSAAVAASLPPAPSALTPSARAFHPSTYVIVHGAWGGGWQWKKVGTLLTADGHLVYRPTLTGLGERVHLASPDLTLTTHITDIVNVILWENLHDVVLVGHSYGGMVITGVMDRVPDRIRRVIFVDAVVPDDGESLNTAFGSIPGADQLKDGFIPATWVKPGKPIPYDVPHPAKTFSEPVSYKNPAALKLPVTYLLTVDAGQTPEQARFYKFYLRAKARGWSTLTMAANHNPEWFKPKELTELLERAAGE